MRPHRTDLISLFFGLVFLGGAAAWALSHVLDRFPAVSRSAAIAGVLVFIALFGLLAVFRGPRRPDGP